MCTNSVGTPQQGVDKIARTITLVSLGLVIVGVFVGTMFSVVQESSVGTFIRICPLH